MGWSIGYDRNWNRDIGYGVPATCDYPGCGVKIDRGLAFVCGSQPYGGDHGCGLYFCTAHRQFHQAPDGCTVEICERCAALAEDQDVALFEPTPDRPEWLRHKLIHSSWAVWRDTNPTAVAAIRAALERASTP